MMTDTITMTARAAARARRRRLDVPRGFAAAAAGAIALTVLFMVWTTRGLGGERVSTAFDDGITVLSALLAAVAALVAGLRRSTFRAAWLLIGAGSLSWAVGEGAWSWYEVVRHEPVPSPSLADVGYLAAVPLILAGLSAMSHGVSSRARTLVDGLVVAGCLLLVSWATVLGPTCLESGSGFGEKVLAAAYPVSDVVILTVAIILLSRAPQGARVPLTVLGIGFAATTVADSVWTKLNLDGTYVSGDIIDTLWVAGYLAVAVAAVWPRTAVGRIADARSSSWRTLLPYAPLVPAAVTVIVKQRDGALDPVLFWTGIWLVGLVILRQFGMVVENMVLARRLAARAAELRASEERFRSLVQNSSDAIAIVDATTGLRYQSPSVERVLGYPPDELRGCRVIDLLHPGDRDAVADVLLDALANPRSTTSVECRIRHRDGRYCHVEMTVTNLLDEPSVNGLVLNTRNITERKALEERLVDQAFHDPLTGLANRLLLRDRLDHALSARGERALSVLFMDLDGFKAINDSLGHSVGDDLLRAVAGRLARCVRPEDTVARLGGDEFAILVEGIDQERASRVAERVFDALRPPFVVGGRDLRIGASIGIAGRGPATAVADELLRNADVAMYSAKANGKGRYETFEQCMHSSILERLEVERALQQAVDAHAFTLAWQPVVALDSGDVVGVEALVRWSHPRRGEVLPGEFIPVAEETGLIVAIGAQVLDAACRQVRTWQLRHPWARSLTVGVNLSPRQVDDPGLGALVERTLASSGLAARHLVLEIGESTLVRDAGRMLPPLQRLRALGVRLAIDDFGTGYSSLSQLRRLPVDILKIDGSFIGDVGSSEPENAIAGAVVGLGNTLGLVTVAEGIESAGQLAALRALGCRLGQGYHLSEPLRADAFEELLGRLRPVGEKGVRLPVIRPATSPGSA